MKANHIIISLLAFALLSACSTTKGIPEGEQLFTGISNIEYDAPEKGEHFITTQEEVGAALATAPNGALFGSSKIRSPFLPGLWIWNEYADAEGGFDKWMLKTFGSKPVLLSGVNPKLRASVGKEVLRAHGYFRGNVDYEIEKQSNPKKAKIGYKVNMGHLFTIDSMRYVGFEGVADSLIDSTKTETLIKKGDAFDVATLEGEKMRITKLLRNNGFYFYQPSFASYLADTIAVPGKVQLRFQQIANIPDMATRKWYIGNIEIDMRKRFMEELHDSVKRRVITVRYNGRRPPVRTPVILRSMKLRPRQLYSYANHQESLTRLSSTGIFSMVDFKFTPRDTTGLSDTLDLKLNCVFDKPYDFYVEANMMGKTNNRLGPGLVIGLTKRNAFRGGEQLDINLRGSYEWQTGHRAEGTSSRLNSYQYGLDVSLQFPRLVIPFANKFRRRLHRRFRRNNFFSMPTTTLKLSTDIIRRASYFKRNVESGEWTYNVQTSATRRHQFSPLIFSYEHMRSTTAKFDSIMAKNPYLYYTMRNQFVPKIQYVFTYTSPSKYRNPIWWQTTVSEAGNLLSLAYMVGNNKWGDKDKRLFGNPYAQFVKVESEFTKTWLVSEHSTLVAHFNAGAIWSFGNSSGSPYSEQFYVGGANSIRAFTVRFVGPGSYHNDGDSYVSYLDQTGDIRLLANLEYRPRLFGNLYGAVFIDAGNVWDMHSTYRQGGTFKLKNVLKETALGTGVGLRYDMDFLVIRVDWGVGLHVPYKSGFYNMDSFKDSQSLHLAIGYPF
ncbi:MAG: BamA/TamA family outer membrane protein [Prevotella sp.]|jgi:outer membrane translocation and assembly module TamA